MKENLKFAFKVAVAILIFNAVLSLVARFIPAASIVKNFVYAPLETVEGATGVKIG